MKKDILFDLDGTLTDPYEGITRSVQYALMKFGITVEDRNELKAFIGPPLTDGFSEYYGLSHEDALKAVEYYRERFAPTGIFENTVYKGIPELLDELKKQGHRLFVATSKPRVFAQKILDKFELSKYFNGVYGSELDGTRVKKDEVISYLLNSEAIEARDCIMVGDRYHDIIGAHKCGVKCIAVMWGYGSMREFEENSADSIALTINELQELLEQ